ncbi:hypothetical protein LAUMK4_04532 [Mycobacterium persicum]|uniref:Uncharacterized protein n=1 Tax=Mycobacterium persicum TaxID=1487726 RepID=A0ABY6RNX2_9MYCO|nr:hypothetical protein LAUMK15_05448 [Mycobacterium persicum]VAZ99287.1 hypothetical protein LAUMK4_04532 [Mycobacterium persicum]
MSPDRGTSHPPDRGVDIPPKFPLIGNHSGDVPFPDNWQALTPEDGKSHRQFFTLAEGENHMAHELLFCETEGAYTAPAFHADTVID